MENRPIDRKEGDPAPSTQLRVLSGRFPRLDALYLRCEKYLPLVTFCLGFIWDAATLTRIDRMLDNLILLGYLAALSLMIIITLRRRAGRLRLGRLDRLEHYFPWLMQFLFGALLSSYVVFYFKSVSWTQTQVFFVILVVLFVGNEFLEQRLGNEKLLAVMFTFCVFSNLAFFLAVILARVDSGVYLLAGAITLALSLGVFALALPAKPAAWLHRMRSASLPIFLVWGLHNLLYFANLIPPVPLALKDAGIYYKVTRVREGYEVQYLAPPRYRFWGRADDPFYLSAGEAAYCYTAVFAPHRVHVPLTHVWSELQPGRGWVAMSRITFEITGGREGGYRGYSKKSTLRPGRWRVDVETDGGRTLGRIDFRVAASPEPRLPLVTRLIR